ncbi:MAG: imidazolonepropionase, partial [Haloarculaceae archaeon]
LVAATQRAAGAVDLTDGTGTLREGAPGDLVILDGPSHVHVPYNVGVNVAETVVKDGTVVAEQGVVVDG